MSNSNEQNKKNSADNEPTPSSLQDDKLNDQRDKIDQKVAQMPKEFGGRSKDKGLEPTRYGDWEFKGRCIDF